MTTSHPEGSAPPKQPHLPDPVEEVGPAEASPEILAQVAAIIDDHLEADPDLERRLLEIARRQRGEAA
jgi:hypothetical protein